MAGNKKYDNIGIEFEGELIFVTVAKYKLFLSYGNIGMDAYVLYSHLMFTARLQCTNQIKAKDIYLRNGLSWGSERLRKAKKLLYQLGIVEKVQRRGESGEFKEVYLKVKTTTTPFEIKEVSTGALETGTPQNGVSVSENKCLNEKDKCLNEKENALIDDVFNDLTKNYDNTLQELAKSEERDKKFDELWTIYDKKVGKEAAIKAFKKITDNQYQLILEHLKEYIPNTEKQYRKNLSTYLHQKSWNDEVIIKNKEPSSFYDKEEQNRKEMLRKIKAGEI